MKLHILAAGLSFFTSALVHADCFPFKFETRSPIFCVGDRVINTDAKYADRMFGTITAIYPNSNPNSDWEYARVIQFDHGGFLDERERLGGRFVTQKLSKDCSEFGNQNVCVSDKVYFPPDWRSSPQAFEVVAIIPSWEKGKYTMLAKNSSGELHSSNYIPLSKGPVPGFTHLSFGEEIPTPFGTHDQIAFFDEKEGNSYWVYLGDTKKLARFYAEDLKFRLSGETSRTITIQQRYENHYRGQSREDLRKKLENDLLDNCKRVFHTSAVHLTDVDVSVKNYKKRRELTIPLPPEGEFSFRRWVYADLSGSARCVHN